MDTKSIQAKQLFLKILSTKIKLITAWLIELAARSSNRIWDSKKSEYK